MHSQVRGRVNGLVSVRARVGGGVGAWVSEQIVEFVGVHEKTVSLF